MSALTAAKLMPKYGPHPIPERQTRPVKSGVTIYPGAAVVLNGGYLAPATTATGLISVGVANPANGQPVDNSSGSDGDLMCDVVPGVFRFANSTSTDAIAQADIGKDCYWVDDQTVAKTDGSSTRSRAGKIHDLNSDGTVQVQLAIGL